MKCGFCEKVSPSKNLTLTPRQRIAIVREIASLKQLNNKNQQEKELLALESKFEVIYSKNLTKTCYRSKRNKLMQLDNHIIDLLDEVSGQINIHSNQKERK